MQGKSIIAYATFLTILLSDLPIGVRQSYFDELSSAFVAQAVAREQTIHSIIIKGNQRIEAATIRSYLTVEPGDLFDPERLDQSLMDLFATGLFDDVVLRLEGDTLVVEVVENPIINRIAFEGNQRLGDEILEAEVQLRSRVVYFTRARVQNAVNRILELYRRNGRFAAMVEPTVIELPENRVDLVFEINEGPLTKVERVVFVGNQEIGGDTLRCAIQTRASAWYRPLSEHNSYNPHRLEFDQELLRRFYLARGHADFNVRSAIAELTPDGRRFIITFTVDEGERYQFGEIDLVSRLRDLEPEALRALLRTEPGETYNADQIEDSIASLTERIGELGYAFVEIEPQLQRRPEERVINLTYVIHEGARIYVERIDIVGNVRTLDEVIRREFLVAEGEFFDIPLLIRSRRQIEELDLYEMVYLKTQPGSSPDKATIEVEVRELYPNEVTVGIGYQLFRDIGSNFAVGAEIKHRQPLGQRIVANVFVGFLASGISTYYDDPHSNHPNMRRYGLALTTGSFSDLTDFLLSFQIIMWIFSWELPLSLGYLVPLYYGFRLYIYRNIKHLYANELSYARGGLLALVFAQITYHGSILYLSNLGAMHNALERWC